ncbi:hypothetical protein HOU00_gp164 [Caulobacter phage CcrPW]|uniref:Uncharacterized protein n=1 Tax=Caulobacter phage CcrPW TaxID=2283271 RepID=A0A385EAP2_9CAUD|nr:hypothetical protein HOU00_gp164 [Caulobacter phage CcrPW]AXQ68961.1 hypothetical protein CcrPW_gp422c [Caulobacter phage CcrPW]
MQVGTMGYDWPLPDPDSFDVKKRADIHLDSDTGIFTIKLRKEVVDLLGCVPQVHGRDLNQTKRDYERKIAQYKVALRNLAREKVIVVYYRRDRRDGHQAKEFQSWAHDHLPTVRLGLQYDVLIKVGKHVYSQQFEEAPLHHEGSAENSQYRKVIPWSEEAEAFFFNMIVSMQGLIDRLDGFLRKGDLNENVKLAIAAGGGLAALPAPSQES